MGCGEAAKGNVAMKFICPYSEDEIVARARSWVGKPVARAEWRQGVTCIHLASFSYGWDDLIPKNWLDWKMSELAELSGWKIRDRLPRSAEMGIFFIRGSEHLGIFTDEKHFIHTGSLNFVEAEAARFMKFYKGVLTWR